MLCKTLVTSASMYHNTHKRMSNSAVLRAHVQWRVRRVPVAFVPFYKDGSARNTARQMRMHEQNPSMHAATKGVTLTSLGTPDSEGPGEAFGCLARVAVSWVSGLFFFGGGSVL